MKRVIGLLCCFVFVSCSTIKNNGNSIKEPENKAAEEELNIQNAFENTKIIMQFSDIPNSYWNRPVSNQSMYFNIFLFDKTRTLNKDNVKKIVIFDNEEYFWEMTPTYGMYSIYNWANYFNEKLSIDGSVLSLEPYRLELNTTTGRKYTKYFNPLENMNINYVDRIVRYIYSELYNGKINSDYINTLDRVIINYANITDEEITISFLITDERTRNARISFYDENRECIGRTSELYNGISKQVHKCLNNGNYFYTDGSENIIRLRNYQFSLYNNSKVSDIKSFNIQLYSDYNIELDYSDKDIAYITTQSDTFYISNEKK